MKFAVNIFFCIPNWCTEISNRVFVLRKMSDRKRRVHLKVNNSFVIWIHSSETIRYMLNIITKRYNLNYWKPKKGCTHISCKRVVSKKTTKRIAYVSCCHWGLWGRKTSKSCLSNMWALAKGKSTELWIIWSIHEIKNVPCFGK